MTSKSRTTKPKDAGSPTARDPAWKIIGLAAVFLGLAALASPVSQANLSPVYGSIPASIYHQQGTTFVTLSALIITNTSLKGRIPLAVRSCIPVLAYYIPLIQWVLFPFSKRFGAVYGPLITEALTFYPLLFLACVSTSSLLANLDLSAYPRSIAEGARPGLSYFFFTYAERAFTSFLPSVIGKTDFMTRSGLQLLIASAYAVFARSPYLMVSVPAMLHTLFANPHHQSIYTDKVLNRTLAVHNYKLLERRDSLTGYVSVLEDRHNMYRVMRCDHSLLGGEWLVNPKWQAQGQTKTETIYPVFTMLESVRLVEGVERKDSESNALFIGLGIGTSPSAFIQHGINTTIVELDPAVYDLALKYFALPTNHTIHLGDAVDFVATTSISNPHEYDYVIHDVFTGGAEPTPLFTLEFLRALDRLLKPDGVVAINYAGDLSLPPPAIILSTISQVFPTCRIFRDEQDEPSQFINMVVFCIKDARAALTFRESTRADWLGSLARRQFLPPREALEISLEQVRASSGAVGAPEILRRGREAMIEQFHRESAVRHWGVMRTVLPNVVWETW